MTFSFNSKQTYLVYRADWTQRYHAQIFTVRAAKHAIGSANRAYSKGSKNIGEIWQAYRDLRATQDDMRTLLEERWASRAEAGRQMQAAKEINTTS